MMSLSLDAPLLLEVEGRLFMLVGTGVGLSVVWTLVASVGDYVLKSEILIFTTSAHIMVENLDFWKKLVVQNYRKYCPRFEFLE